MKYLYLLALITLSILKSYSQSKIEKAVFESCMTEQDSYNCSKDRILDDFYNLINKTLLSTTVQLEGNYLTLSVVFIIDGEGKLITEDTEVQSNHEPLKIAVERYLRTLPIFIPKDTGTDKRTLYTFNEIYLYNTETSTYEHTEVSEISKKGLKVITEKIETSLPRHPRCKATDNIAECTYEEIQWLIKRNYKFPQNARGIIRMNVIFDIDEDGTVTITKIIGADEAFKKETLRVLKRLPKFVPAKIKGLPLKTYYNLPLTINIT